MPRKRPESLSAHAQWAASEVYTFNQGGVTVDSVGVIVSYRKGGETFLEYQTIGNEHANEKAVELVADGGADDPEPVQESGAGEDEAGD